MKKTAVALLSLGILLSSFSVALAEDSGASGRPGKAVSCQAKMDSVSKRSTQLTKRARNMEDVFSKIAKRVEDYYASKSLSVSNYQVLVTAIADKKAAVDTALTEAQSKASSFSCADVTTAKAQVQEFKVAMQKVIAALKDYKTSVKNLIVAVRTAAGKVKPSPTP